MITDSSGNIVYEYEDIQGMKESFFGFEELEGYSEGSTKISKIYMNNEDYETSVFYVAKSIDARTAFNNVDGFAIEIIDLSKISEILSKSSYGDGKGSSFRNRRHRMRAELRGYRRTEDRRYRRQRDKRDVMKSTAKPTSAENNVDYNAGGKLGCYNYFTGASSSNWKWVSVSPCKYGNVADRSSARNIARYYGGSCRYMRTSRYSHHKVYRKPDERDGKGCP